MCIIACHVVDGSVQNGIFFRAEFSYFLFENCLMAVQFNFHFKNRIIHNLRLCDLQYLSVRFNGMIFFKVDGKGYGASLRDAGPV